jgi:hypothetical protein
MVSVPEKFTAPAWITAPAATARRAVSPVTRLSSTVGRSVEHDAVAGDAVARPYQQPVAAFSAAAGTRTSSAHRGDARIRP